MSAVAQHVNDQGCAAQNALLRRAIQEHFEGPSATTRDCAASETGAARSCPQVPQLLLWLQCQHLRGSTSR